MTSVHVICTSVGNDGFPSILDALKKDTKISVTGIDCDPSAPGLFLADRGAVVQRRKMTDELIAQIIGLIRPECHNILLPLSTEDQDFFAEHKNLLEKHGIAVAVASRQALQIANDKHEIYRHCIKIGASVPSHVFATTFKELAEAIRSYSDHGLRCVIKLARGTGAQGVKIIDPNLDRSNCFWSRTKLTIYPSDAIDWFAKYGISETIMVSDYIEGEHISIDAVRTAQSDFYGSARTEIRHLYGLALTGKTIKDPDILQKAKKLAESIDLTGAMNLEYRRDIHGIPQLLEINPRFAGSVGHTVAAGMNLPLLLVHSLLALPISPNELVTGCCFYRCWQLVVVGGISEAH